MVRIVKISCDETQNLEEEIIIDSNVAGGDVIPTYLQSTHVMTCNDGSADVVIDTTPLIRMSYPTGDNQKDADLSSSAGLYAYSISSTSKIDNSTIPNIRATRLSMACGCHAQRFVGDIWVGKLGYIFQENGGYILTNLDLSISDVEYASVYSPDLRTSIVDSIMMQRQNKHVGSVSEWLGNAQQKKYHDGEVMNALATAMTRADVVCDEEGESSDDDDSSSSSDSCSSSTSSMNNNKNETADHNQTVITETTLCLHCRGPAKTLCTNCGGAYFCAEPRKCSTNGYVFSVLFISFAYTHHLMYIVTSIWICSVHNNVYVSKLVTQMSLFYLENICTTTKSALKVPLPLWMAGTTTLRAMLYLRKDLPRVLDKSRSNHTSNKHHI